MRALQVTLDALRAQHAAIEGEFFPRLEANDFVVVHFQLNAALLAAETAVRFYQALRLDARRQPIGGHHGKMRTVPIDDAERIRWKCRHVCYSVPTSGREFIRCCHSAPC